LYQSNIIPTQKKLEEHEELKSSQKKKKLPQFIISRDFFQKPFKSFLKTNTTF